MQTNLAEVTFLGFDVFGTVVDWRSGVAREAAPFLRRHNLDVDPFRFADEWRALYQPAMQRIRSGERAFVKLDLLNRENLEIILSRHGADFGAIPDEEIADLNTAWEKLDPWPDVLAGLTRLKRKVAIGPISNSHIAGMLNLARFGNLPWDVITGAEIAQNYKPMPQTYLKSIEAVGRRPWQTAMVAAHNSDLEAARRLGMRTIFILRPAEHGPQQDSDLSASEAWDVETASMEGVADALGC